MHLRYRLPFLGPCLEGPYPQGPAAAHCVSTCRRLGVRTRMQTGRALSGRTAAADLPVVLGGVCEGDFVVSAILLAQPSVSIILCALT